MKCHSPLSAYLAESGGLVFHPMAKHGDAKEIKIPCRQCLACRLNHASQWQTRLVHESKLHEHSIFLTLTYDEQNLPEHGTLVTEHLQQFFKTLRKAIHPIKIRYFACGEYGDTTRRAHYHAIVFGWEPTDGILHTASHDGSPLYTSKFLSTKWRYGHHLYSRTSPETMGYVARYSVKKQKGASGKAVYKHIDDETGELTNIKPPFAIMSLKPGIGFNYMDKFKDDYFRTSSTIVSGKRKPLPNAYIRKLKRIDPDWHMDFSDRGQEFANEHKEDYTFRRMADAEKVLKASVQSLKRKL